MNARIRNLRDHARAAAGSARYQAVLSDADEVQRWKSIRSAGRELERLAEEALRVIGEQQGGDGR